MTFSPLPAVTTYVPFVTIVVVQSTTPHVTRSQVYPKGLSSHTREHKPKYIGKWVSPTLFLGNYFAPPYI